VLYFVEPLRDGKSYTAHSVKAVQEGRVVFILMCSFQRPEPWQPSTQWKMPTVPSPDECEEDEVRYVRLANADGVDACKKQTLLDFATVRGSFLRVYAVG
jgi:acyl-CoA thioesterase II